MKALIGWAGWVLFVIWSTRAAGAETPWEGPAFSASPAALIQAATAQPEPKDADVELLFEATSYRFDDQGRQQRTLWRVYRCLTQQGVDDWSYTETGWSPWCEERPSIRARVITPDGVAHPLDSKSIGEVPVEQYSPDVLSDRRVLRAPLPAITVGAVVEEEIVIRETQPLCRRGSLDYFALVRFWPVRKLRLSIDAPASLPLRYTVRGAELKPVRTEQDGRVRLVFEMGPVPKTKYLEEALPPELPPWGQVVFTTGKSWTEMADEYAQVVETQLDLETVQSLVQETLAGQTDRQKVVAALVAKLQQLVRYTGLEFGEAAIVPRTPRETLTRRYGDCKDQATLLVAMLRAAGLSAHVALLSAGTHADIVPDMPGLDRFNHAIVYLPGEPPLWIDPTARYVPVGQLPIGDQGRWALVASRQTKRLVQTPRAAPGENRSVIVREYTLSQWDKARVRETITTTGSCGEESRSRYAAANDKDMRKNWRAYAEEAYHSRNLESLTYPSSEKASKTFEIVAEIKDAEIGQVDDTEASVSLWPASLFTRLPELFTTVRSKDSEEDEDDEASSPRKSPMLLPEPHVRELRYRVVPPPGFAPRSLPETKVQKLGPATIRQEFQRDGNTVVATFHLDTGLGRFTPEEVEALRRGIAELGVEGDVDRWEVALGFDHLGAQHLAAGRMKEAILEYRRLVDQAPKQAGPHSQYAHALVQAGFGDAARQHARRAVELAPDSAEAAYQLAQVLTYDLVGRHFRPGIDWDGAATAYRKSLELEPSAPAVHWDYAILLSRGRHGDVFAPDAKLEESAAEYRKAREQLAAINANAKAEIHDLEANTATNLMHLARYAEMEECLRKADASLTRDALWVAAIAIRQGVAAAEQKAAELRRDRAERQEVLSGAGDFLQGARHYPLAVKLYETVLPGAANRTQFEAVVASVRLSRRLDEIDLPKDDPCHVIQRFCHAALIDEGENHRLAEYCVQAAHAHDVTVLADAIRRPLFAVRERVRQQSFSLERLSDTVAMLQMTPEGDATVGYRIRPPRQLPSLPLLYVTIERGSCRLMPSGPDEANLGAEALRRLTAGEAAAARRWLDWAWDVHAKKLGWFDQFSGSPFAHLWRTTTRDDPKTIRLAAAALVAEGNQAAEAIPILEEARKEETAARLLLQIDRALARAYWHADRSKDALAVLERILAKHPQVQEAVDLQASVLWALGRWDELSLRFKAQLARTGKDPKRLELLACRVATIGDFPLADQTLRRLADEKKASPIGLNELAWNALFQPPVSERALQDALEANERTLHQESAPLHTLAALYAESGRTAEALATLHRSMEVRLGPPQGPDWYVLGRIAEQYGLNELAGDLYRKVPRPQRPAANDVSVLAKARLEKLPKEGSGRNQASFVPD